MISNERFPVLFSIFENYPYPVFLIKNWKIFFSNQKAIEFLKNEKIENLDLLTYIQDNQKKYIHFQLSEIETNQWISFPIYLTLKNEVKPFIANLFFLEKQEDNYYYLLILQDFHKEEQFSDIKNILLQTLHYFGNLLFEEILNKIVETYQLTGAIIIFETKANELSLESSSIVSSDRTIFVSSNIKKTIDYEKFKLPVKLKKRLQKNGNLYVSGEFHKKYQNLNENFKTESLAGIYVSISETEDFYYIVFSEQEKEDIQKIISILNITSIRIIYEYLRNQNFIKYERLYRIFYNSNEGIFFYNIEKDKLLDFNESFAKILGIDRKQLLEKEFFEVLNQFTRNRFEKIFKYYYKKNRIKNNKIRFTFVNAKYIEIPIELSVSLLKENNNTIFLGIIRDLTYPQQAIQQYRKFLQTLNLLNIYFIEIDKDFNIVYINYSTRKDNDLFKRNNNFLSVISPDYSEYVKMVLEQLFKNKGVAKIRFPILSTNSRNDWYEGDFIFFKEKNQKYVRCILKDITLEYISEKQRIYLLEQDFLTSIPNRNRLEEDLYKAILRSERQNTKFAFGFIDLDNFFYVNEKFGYRFGDLILSNFAERLMELDEISNSIYRWGGDQFAFIFENTDFPKLKKFLENLKNIIKKPFSDGDEIVYITFSVGISLFPDDGINIEKIIGEADRAMKYAKQLGKNQILMAKDLPDQKKNLYKIEIQSYLLQYISEKKIIPYYQPIFDIETNKIVGVEVLARMNQNIKNYYIGPDVFIPIAEEMGIIEDLSKIVVFKSFEFFKRIFDIFKLYISINISKKVLFSDDFFIEFVNLQKKLNLDPRYIALEITESLVMLDREISLKKLYSLKELGFRIAIDDFGTGYSSLSEISDLPVDILKVDRAFLKRLKQYERNRVLDAIVHLAKSLELDIIVEGAEDYKTVMLLKNMGVRYIQGYFFSPPLTEAEFERKLYYEESFFEIST